MNVIIIMDICINHYRVHAKAHCPATVLLDPDERWWWLWSLFEDQEMKTKRGKNRNLLDFMANQTLSAYQIPFRPSRLRLRVTSSRKPSQSSRQFVFSSPISQGPSPSFYYFSFTLRRYWNWPCICLSAPNNSIFCSSQLNAISNTK